MKMRSRVWLVFAVCSASACTKPVDSPTNAGSEVAAKAADPKGGAAVTETKAAGLPEASVLLDKAVDAVGGKAKIEAMHSFYTESAVEIDGQNIRAATKLWWKDGDFYTEQDMGGVGMLRAGKQGDVIWSDDPINGRRKLSGVEAEQLAWASSLVLAADWQRHFARAETVAERQLGGKRVYDVKLTSKTGAENLVTFDADTGLNVAQKFEQASPMGKVPVSVSLEDYREHDGVKVAFKLVTDASLLKATQVITKLEFGAEVDTTRFAMPSGGAQVVKPDTIEAPSPPPPGE